MDYALTELGLKLVPPLRALYDWAEQHRPEMLAARDAFVEREREEAPRRAAYFAAR